MGMFLNRGNQEFDYVVNSEIYVDKTEMITFFNKKINTEQRYISVSRPRRFGKSITANMIAAYFEKGCDSRYLFENRKLGETKNWDQNLNKYDVIRIDLADIRSRRENPEETLDYIDEMVVKELDAAYPDIVDIEKDGIADALTKINDKNNSQFIIIIDEWDCFYRDDKNNTKVQERYINLLRGLFKGNSAKKFLALGYITGILPIKKYNSESALNNFYEYTMLQPGKLAQYIGFTEDEVKNLCEQYDMDYGQAMEWYDGYSFRKVHHICGPNSVVKAMLEEEYANYWSQTVAYNSLLSYISMNFDGLKEDIKIMIGGQRVKVKVRTYQNDMISFRNKHDVMTVLIHLGYLAYDSENEEAYIPNKEVRMCFEDTIEGTNWSELIETMEHSEELLRATMAGDAEEVARQIDYSHSVNTSILNYNNENALASCIMLAYYTARKEYRIIREYPTGYGFADLVFLPKEGISYEDHPAMVIELKWKKDAKTAITQIKENQYCDSLKDYKGKLLLVGISYEKSKDSGETNKKHSCVIEEMGIN